MYRFACGAVLGSILAVRLAGQSTITLSPATIPATGQPGITSITLTGSGFPTGTILPQNVTVTLSPTGPGSPVTTQASSVTTVIGTTRRVTFLIPTVISVTAPATYQASVSSSGPVGFSSGSSRAAFTVNPPASIGAVSPNSATVGQSLSVSITGQYSRFLNGTTQVRFGQGISVGNGPVGGYGPVLVTSATSAVAQIAVDASAVPGPRPIEIQTGLERASSPAGFEVTAGVPPLPTVVTLSTTTEPAIAPPGEFVSVGVSGLPAGTINPTEINVYFNPAPGAVATPRTMAALSLVPGTGSTPAFLLFQVPSAMIFNVDMPFRISMTGRTAAGVVFVSSNTAALTVAATLGRLLTVSPASALPGATIQLTVTGQATNFHTGTTQASFGAGISVGPGTPGGFGPLTALNPNTGTVTLTIDAAAAPGPRTVTVRTGANQFSLPGGFTVLCAYRLTTSHLSFGATGGNGSFQIAAGPACPWTASSNASWITITSPPQGSGNGSLSFNVAAKPNSGLRSGTITAGGQLFTISQADCSYTLEVASQAFPASGTVGATVQVGALAGCPWTATTSYSWIQIRSGTESGSGNGTVIYDLEDNLTPSQRVGTIAIAGLSHIVVQAAAFTLTCTAPGVGMASVRGEGLTEQIGDIVFTCSGASANLRTGDIRVRLNTPITSKTIVPAQDGALEVVDALLLIDDPANPSPGTNAFLGTRLGPGEVGFADVPLVGGGVPSRTFRLTNIRADATQVPGAYADIDLIQKPGNSVYTAATGLLVATSAPGVASSVGDPVASPSPMQVSRRVVFRESLAAAFKPRIASNQEPSTPGVDYETESGFVNTAALGANVGTAANGTRLMVRLRRLPAHVRVFAPVYPQGNTNVQMVAQDNNGSGAGFLTGTPAFGGVYEEVVITDGAGTATWEVRASNPFAIETLECELVFIGGTLTDVWSVSVHPMLAPLGTVSPGQVLLVPLFRDPSIPIIRPPRP